MTEDEAKTKWCPESIFAVDSPTGQSGNRWDNGDGSSTGSYANNACNCLGSACMAWRRIKDISNLAEIEKARQLMAVGSGYYKIEPEFKNTEHGYCGKAGKP